MQTSKKGKNRQFVRTARALVTRLGRSNLAQYMKGVALVRPRGRSVVFETVGNAALQEALQRRSDFCRDSKLGGVLHPGGPSFRELNGVPGLHISFHPFEQAAIHVDHMSPAVAANSEGTCIYDRSRAARHIGQDVLPSLVRTPEGAGLSPPGWAPSHSAVGPAVLRVSGLGRPHRMYRFRAGMGGCGSRGHAPVSGEVLQAEIHRRRAPPEPYAASELEGL